MYKRQLDQKICNENGIVLTNTPDAVRRPVAVSIMTLMLALSGKLFIKDRITRGADRTWSQRAAHMGVGLVGKTLGSLGVGSIAGEMFRMASVYGMQHIAHDPFRNREINQDLDVTMVELEQLFRESDVLCINCDLNPGTEGLVDSRLLSLMKPNAFLINTARGDVVDNDALIAALENKVIAGAGLDVFEGEPNLKKDFLKFENAVLLPHLGSASKETRIAMGMRVVENLDAFFSGKEPGDRVA